MKTGNTEKERALRWIRIGLAGALLTMLGDLLLMAFDTPEADGMIGSFLSAAQQTTYTRIGLAAFCGFVGIPLSGLGYYALCHLTQEKYRQTRSYKLYCYSALAFSALGGGIHILCCLILTSLKKNMETGTVGNDAVLAVLKELGGALIPSTLVFLVLFGVMVVTMILLIAGHRTCLPGWMAWINPMTMKLVINGTRFLGTSALVNGISCSNMSFGCIVALLFWLTALKKEVENETED